MSASMVRKGLELFSEDLASIPGSGSSKKKKKPSALLSTTNKTGLKKLKRKDNKVNNRGTSLTVKGKKVKSSADNYNKQKSKNNTKDALKYLSLLSSKKTSTKVVQQVSEYQQRRAVKRVKPEQPQRKPREAKSCFSEEDFARFEREYFVGPRKR